MAAMLASRLPPVKQWAAHLPRPASADTITLVLTRKNHEAEAMSKTNGSVESRESVASSTAESDVGQDRRAALKRLGRFAMVSAPAVTLLLAAGSKPSQALPCSPCSSSRAFKTPEGGVDTEALLAAVASLPVEAWRYKPETGLESRTHIGPYAEDFQAAFGLGDGVTISPLDALGVCLAAIQALSKKVESLEAQLAEARAKQAR
jgi:hypothetical protein